MSSKRSLVCPSKHCKRKQTSLCSRPHIYRLEVAFFKPYFRYFFQFPWKITTRPLQKPANRFSKYLSSMLASVLEHVGTKAAIGSAVAIAGGWWAYTSSGRLRGFLRALLRTRYAKLAVIVVIVLVVLCCSADPISDRTTSPSQPSAPFDLDDWYPRYRPFWIPEKYSDEPDKTDEANAINATDANVSPNETDDTERA